MPRYIPVIPRFHPKMTNLRKVAYGGDGPTICSLQGFIDKCEEVLKTCKTTITENVLLNIETIISSAGMVGDQQYRNWNYPWVSTSEQK
jgi:hypothetical protein